MSTSRNNHLKRTQLVTPKHTPLLALSKSRIWGQNGTQKGYFTHARNDYFIVSYLPLKLKHKATFKPNNHFNRT